MECIIAFKCAYCNKIYSNKESCRTHEYKCYFNPKTKSCAGCAFFLHEEVNYKQGHIACYQACMKNIDITKKLKTDCDYHLPIKYSEDSEIMDEVWGKYKSEIFIKAALDRLSKA